MKVTAVAAGLAFPHAAQAIQVVRRRRRRGTKKWSPETVYAITGHGCPEKPRYHDPAAGRLRQHRHPQFATTPAGRTGPTDDHELLMLTLPRPWLRCARNRVRMAGMATAKIILKRDSGYADRLRTYQITLDNEVIGGIADGQEATFDVEPGPIPCG